VAPASTLCLRAIVKAVDAGASPGMTWKGERL
jgi:hypothetical protein